MKNRIVIIGLCLILGQLAVQLQGQYSGGGEGYPDLPTHQESLENFQDMRFGMFIHWGPVSLRGEEISWSRGREIPIEEYDLLYQQFNPELFNAEAWVNVAKMAGMKYLVITTRHHDGFSLWDSKYTDYDMAATPYGKGILKELSEECRKQGIAFGTYYSICDWYRPDYPVVYPYPENANNAKGLNDQETMDKMENYIAFMKNQLNELIHEYNSFLIWFDGEWEWAWTHEMGMDMYAYLRRQKNDLLINNRVDKGRQGMEDKVRNPIYAGDYGTPEQQIGAFDNVFTWETNMTIGKQWAWKPDDELKSRKECIHTLAQTLGGDGNLLFNVGPMPDGQIEARQVDRLREMGQWVKVNQEAIYGTRGGPYLPTEELVSTHKGKHIYLYLLKNPGAELCLPMEDGIRVKQARFLQSGSLLEMNQKEGKIILSLPSTLPDEVATVIVLELDIPASGIATIEL